MKKSILNILIGIILMIGNSIWAYHFGWLLYAYQLPGILWYFMYPDWVLISNILIGLIGIIIGFRLILNQISIKTALLIDLPILLCGLLISNILAM